MELTKVKHKYLFIAVKPQYANKLISGQKNIELRKMKPHIKQGDYVIIYASSPVKAVIGFGKVKEIIEKTPIDMWSDYSDRLGVTWQEFNLYYEGYNRAIGIVFEKIKPIKAIELEELKKVDPKFHPPQIYRYVTNEDIHKVLLKNE